MLSQVSPASTSYLRITAHQNFMHAVTNGVQLLILALMTSLIMYRTVILTSRLQGVAGTNNVELPPTDSMRMVVVVRSSIPVPRSCVSLDREPFAFSSSPSTCAADRQTPQAPLIAGLNPT